MQEQDRPNTIASIWDLRYPFQKVSPAMLWMLRWEVISWNISCFLLLISVWPSETVCRVPALHPGEGCCCSAAESARLGQQLHPVGQAEEQGQRTENSGSSHRLPVLPSLSSTPLCPPHSASLHVAHRAASVLEHVGIQSSSLTAVLQQPALHWNMYIRTSFLKWQLSAAQSNKLELAMMRLGGREGKKHREH